MPDDDSYWDSPGAKAAEAADKAKNPDDYWNTPGVQDAMVQSAELATQIEFLKAQLDYPGENWNEYRHYAKQDFGDEATIKAKLAELQKTVNSLGYYSDPIPDDYRGLLDIARSLGRNWVWLVTPGQNGSFVQHCDIVWYYGPGWHAWCVPWDVDTATQAIRDHSV